MKRLRLCILVLIVDAPCAVSAWGSHNVAAYRALERMPEVVNAKPVVVEPLDAFLRGEGRAIEALLAGQEAWAKANLLAYPARPAALAYKADAGGDEAGRKLTFLQALRVAPDSRLALYLQPDPRDGKEQGETLPYDAVNTLPEPPNASIRFVAVKPGQTVSALSVLATASQEPDLGLDINVWDDSPSEWGPRYGFGKLPFGNPTINFSTQAPFHMGFFHEDRIVYLAAPFLKRTFPMLRAHQYSTLATLAFRTGHPYWGWRFSGMALHYVQDLTQPFHASLAPGYSTARLLGINLMAMVGLSGAKQDLVVLLSNRHLALEAYQAKLVLNASVSRADNAIIRALQDTSQDARYPAWSDLYARDVVAQESYDFANTLNVILVNALPSAYVQDPAFDFGASDVKINKLMDAMAKMDPAKVNPFNDSIAELLGHFGAHSRNAMRGILSAAGMARGGAGPL